MSIHGSHRAIDIMGSDRPGDLQMASEHFAALLFGLARVPGPWNRLFK